MADWKQLLNVTDIATARLIVQLQLQDAATLASSNANGGQQSDAEIARKIFEDELKEIQGLFPSRALGETTTDKENDCEAVREAAAFGWNFDEYRNQVNDVAVPPDAGEESRAAARFSFMPSLFWDQARSWFSDLWPAPPPPPVKLVTCTACTDRINQNDTVKAPCGHSYCQDCLESLFRSSMTDETLYPPRCCKRPIPVSDARKVLSRDLSTEFINRQEEFETKNKTYCYRPQCAAFIRPYIISGNLARCPRCRHSTCAECKNQWHFGNCPADEGLEQLLATAEASQWRRCPECRRVIELSHGCNHITCRCRHEFCYICGQAWRTCRCARWDEARLLERGQQLARNFIPNEQAQAWIHVVAARPPHPLAPVQYETPNLAPLPPTIAPPLNLSIQQYQQAQMQFQQQLQNAIAEAQHAAYQRTIEQAAVQQAVDHIREHHECRHEAFTTYRQPGDVLHCEICGGNFRHWIKQCQRCFMLMCGRCRHNRLPVEQGQQMGQAALGPGAGHRRAHEE